MTLQPVAELGRRAKAASRVLATTSTAAKDAALAASAEMLVQRTGAILEANADDVARAEAAGTAATVVDRLRLSPARIAAMADGLRQVAALPDPVGEIVGGWTRPNGLVIEKVRVPLGVVAIIYENRPNVTSDAFGLCLKSGNAAFLRGSSAALASNLAIADTLREGVDKAGLPTDAVVLVDDVSHETAVEFMRLRQFIDCLIQRGGPLPDRRRPGARHCPLRDRRRRQLPCLCRRVRRPRPGPRHRRQLQDPTTVRLQRAESLIVHASVAAQFLPRAAAALVGVELVGDDRARALVPSMAPATDADFGTEFLDLKMSVAVVDSLDDAIAHVNRYGSGHTEAICTTDLSASRRFAREVDAAAVIVNASTRFTDGEQFGFGAEIGISTQKLHARGPMGLPELTTLKYVVHGEGQVRG